MRSALILVLVVALFAVVVYAQVGCCCDPLVHNGSFASRQQCDAQGFVFAGAPLDLTTTCSTFCSESIQPSSCGDGVCQSLETASLCPTDCADSKCGNPTVRPAPQSLTLTPVQGKKALKIDFLLSCPTSYVSVERCTGIGCLDFALVAQIPRPPFIDEDPALEFNREYTYRVVAFDRVFGASEPAFVQGNAGDLECLGAPARNFCLSSTFYNRFDDYLKTFGYGLFSPLEFLFNFEGTMGRTFATRLNQPWQCDARNRLVSPVGQSRCAQGQVCVADEQGARCATPADCEQGSPFGLAGNKGVCESQYCFFDKGLASIDECRPCSAAMTCNDYKTKGACETDNCGTGVCQWKPIIDALGTGVCADTGTSNCAFCQVASRESLLWDACREEKSAALSTPLFPCFFDKDRKLSKICSQAACSDYTQSQCGSTQAIRISGNNSLVSSSTDPCGIRVCEFHDETGCVKNADGSQGASFQDCQFGNKTCELDYFPPVTTLIPNGTAGKIEFINFNVFDKEFSGGPLKNYAGKSGYITYLCVKRLSNVCGDASTFIPVTSARLILSNRLLKEGNRTIAQVASGNNTIVFYSRDPANNLEGVKEGVVFACDNCNGPVVLNISVTSGRAFGTRIFTASSQPIITFTFDGPTTISYAELKNPVRSISLQQLTTGALNTHQFSASGLEGSLELYLNAFNDRLIYMDPHAVKFDMVVNASVPKIEIIPGDGAIVLKNLSSLDVLLNFSGQVTLRSVQLVSDNYADPFARRLITRDITELRKGLNNRSFTALVPNVTGGSYALVVDAQAFNTLPIMVHSRFFVATQQPRLRLIEPPFGVTPFSSFNVTLETPLPSQCSYVYNTPQPPNSSDFAFFNRLSGEGTLHKASGFSIPFGAEGEYQLHAYCRFDLFNVCWPNCQRSFNISFDAEPPFIVNAFAEPNVISERFTPDAENYATTLKVQLDKPGFCKYSGFSTSFEVMEGFFPGFDEIPKTALAVDINVSSVQDYTFHVACKGKNQLVSDAFPVLFSVDLSRTLNISSTTSSGFATPNFSIGVVANKRVVCYFGEQSDDVTKCMGACKTGHGHNQDVVVSGEGEHVYFVKCVHPTGEQSEVLNFSVFVDTSPPVMEEVSDESALLSDRNISWSLKSLRLSLKGSDEQSGIAYYLVSIQDQRTRQFVVRDKAVYPVDGESVYINLENISLMDGEQYVVSAHAVNKVGLRSEPLASDGFAVDSSQRPPVCFDGEQTSGETDVDCGGSCEPCGPDKHCISAIDCDTNLCDQGACKIASCTDGLPSGVESDVDCGGKYCGACADARSCRLDTDCTSQYCDPLQKKCKTAPACADKELSAGESDIDCGGPCDGCGEEKTCQSSSDCAQGLNCEGRVCSASAPGDEDSDGVLDETDNCPLTPFGEGVDEQGCAPSQVSSKGDGITDKWRIDHFGCVDCDEALADNDADADGLTNLEEFTQGTNPVEEDTDGDGWADGNEISAGTNPADPASHPASSIGVVLWILFAVLILGGVVYGGYLLKEARNFQQTQSKPAVIVQAQPPEKSTNTKLKAFAKKEDLSDQGWLSVDELKEKEIPQEIVKSQPRPVDKDQNPLNNLKQVVKRLSPEEQEDLRTRLENIDVLPRKEKEEIFGKLKITAKYFEQHQENIRKELKR